MPETLRRAINAAGVALWSWHVAKDQFGMDDRGCALWAVPQTDALRFEDLSARIHPADRDRVRVAFVANRGVDGPYETDFRIMIEEEIRWISARGLGNDSGMHSGYVYGVFLDVTDRKQAEESHELLAGEMSHRVKNLLTVASGLNTYRLTLIRHGGRNGQGPDSSPNVARKSARSGAATARSQGTAALLGDLLVILLSPYEDLGASSGRIRVSVPRMGLGEAAASTLALVVHELATNSVKYGALALDVGTLDLSGSTEGEVLKLVWMERGGLRGKVPNAAVDGFGSRLIARSVTGQLGGTIEYTWEPDGLIVTLMLKAAKLAS